MTVPPLPQIDAALVADHQRAHEMLAAVHNDMPPDVVRLFRRRERREDLERVVDRLALGGPGEIPADTIIWDLEDGIPAQSKQLARECIARLPPKPPRMEYGVRINGGDPAEVDLDIEVVAKYPFDSVTLPKGETGAEIARQMRLIGDDKSYAVTIESVRGLQSIDEIAQVLRPGRDALGFGVGDMSTDLGVDRLSTCENPYFQQILGIIALTGKRYGLQLLDSVSARFNDPENARKEAQLSYRCFGYTGKKLINPKQLEAINSTYSPTHAEMAGHVATLESFFRVTSKTNARVVATEYKGLPAFIASERHVKRYLRQGYVQMPAGFGTVEPAQLGGVAAA